MYTHVDAPVKVWKDQDVVVTAYLTKIGDKKVTIEPWWRQYSAHTRTITWAEIWEKAGEEFETEVEFSIYLFLRYAKGQ